MTDLKLTKLCAEAMDLSIQQASTMPRKGYWCWELGRPYNPLHGDAQAMALVKKFGLFCHLNRMAKLYMWCVKAQGTGNVRNADLNHAIVECIAKMQQAKQEGEK